MPVCTLSIQLDNQNGVFYPGQPVSGKVLVDVHKNCTCNGLTVRLSWFTHGQSNKAEGEGPTPTKTLIAQGKWQAGQKLEFPFTLTAPIGPVSYHGHYINVDWQVEARADIPLALDPKTAVPIALVAAPGQKQFYLGPTFRPPDGQAALTSMGSTVLVSIGAICLATALIAGLPMDAAIPASDSAGRMMVYIVPGIQALVGFGLIFAGFFKKAAAKRLGPPDITIEPNFVAPGAPVTATVRIKPNKAVVILGAKATITGEERARRGSGSHAHTYTHTFHQQTFALADAPGRVETGQEKILQWQFVVPKPAPPTFAASDNHVEWSIKFDVEIDNWPDWSDKRMLGVTPEPSTLPTID